MSLFVIIISPTIKNKHRKVITMEDLFGSISTGVSGATPTAVLKILTSNLSDINLETLFNTFISAWMSFLETLFGMLA